MKLLFLFPLILISLSSVSQFTEKSKIFKAVRKNKVDVIKSEIQNIESDGISLDSVTAERYFYGDSAELYKLNLVQYTIIMGDLETLDYLYSIKEKFSNFQESVNTTFPYIIHEFENDKIEYILDKGGDINGACFLCDDGRALSIALQYENIEITESLLSRGVNVNYKNKSNHTPLMGSILLDSFRVDIFDEILAQTNDINVSTDEEMSALSYALYFGNDYAARRLLAKGAMLVENDQSNLIASGIMDLFSQFRNDEWIKNNINRWVEYNDEEDRYTLLDLAVLSENYKMVKTLIREYDASLYLNEEIIAYDDPLYTSLYLENEKVAQTILNFGEVLYVDKHYVKQAKKMKYSEDIINQLMDLIQ